MREGSVPSSWFSSGLLAIALGGAGAACADDPDTLLQITVHAPADLGFQTLRFTIAGTETRTYRASQPDVLATIGPDGLGVDMRLPRRLSGPQPVAVRALDAAGCVVAAQTTDVDLVPGARVDGGSVWLAVVDPLAPPDCDGEADDGGAADGAAGGDASGGPDGATAGDRGDARDGATGGAGGAAGDAATDSGVRDGPAMEAAPEGPPPRVACPAGGDCGTGKNCLAGYCEDAPAACADIVAKDAARGDGVYWLTRAGAPILAYCDMRIRAILCTETAEEHTGQTRDATHLDYRMTSQLEFSAGRCRIWAVRDASAGYPLDQLHDWAASGASKTCATLGFRADVSFGACSYGANPGYTNCGFPVSGTFYKWGNNCDCGTYPNQYAREGAIYVSSIPWNFSGSQFGRCSVR